MCDPVSLAVTTMAVSAGSAVLGFQGAKADAKGARQAAGLNYAQAYNADADRLNQIGASQSENTVSSLIARAQASGRISASAGSMGLADPTVAAQGNAVANTVGRDAAINDLNAQNQRAEVIRDTLGADLKRRTTIQANKGPSPLELVFGLAKAGLQGASTYGSAGGTFGGSTSGTSGGAG